MPKSPQEMVAAIVRNMATKTGKPLAHWVKTAKQQGPAEKKALVAWLESTHGLGHVTAVVVADETLSPGTALGKAYDDLPALLEAQYAGERAGLRAIHDKVVRHAKKLGKDVSIEIRKSYVALARGAQFAQLKAATKDRVDLSLHLPGIDPDPRLVALAGDDRMTHRVALRAAKDVDARVLEWLAVAYAGSGK